MHLPKSVWLLSTAVIATACTPKYVAPISFEGAEPSYVRIIALTPVPLTLINTFEGPGCKGPIYFGRFYGSESAQDSEHQPKGMLGGKSGPDGSIVEQIVSAKQTTILFTSMEAISNAEGLFARTCKLAISFPVAAGEQYEVQYGYENQCAAQVMRLLPTEAGIERQRIETVTKVEDKCIPTRF